MDITVYLPDELGQKAKDEGLNLSRLLRNAVTDELHVREMIASAYDPRPFTLDLENENGDPFTGRFTGRLLGEWTAHNFSLYLTDDERLIYYDGNNFRYYEIELDEDAVEEALLSWPADETVSVMGSLGMRATVDI